MPRSSRIIFFFIVRHKIMFYILYIFMAGKRAVEGRERRKAGQQKEGCEKGVSGGAAQGGQVSWDQGLVQRGAGQERASGGVKRPDVCEGDESGCREPKAGWWEKERRLKKRYLPR